ncbi:hypothetical protein TNCV_1279081 [Trichonephila clavipes]|nr:hypothetical protein TNCV_1279081 [Trichonephila clavipes]
MEARFASHMPKNLTEGTDTVVRFTETTHKRAPRPSYYHERYQRYYGRRLRKAQEYSSWYLSPAQFYVQ